MTRQKWLIVGGIVVVLLLAGGAWWYATDILPERRAKQSITDTATEETCSPRGTGTCDGNGRPIKADAPGGSEASAVKTLSATQVGARTVTLTGAGSQGIDIDPETGLIYVGNQGSATCAADGGNKTNAQKGGDTLSIVDPIVGKENVNIATGVSPIWPLVDVKRNVVYVAGSGGTLEIHERGTGTKKKTIDIGRSPHAVGLSTDGIIVVSNTKDGSQKYYAALNADTQQLIAHHQVIDYPHSVSYYPEKNVFYMIGVEDGKVAVIDGKTGASLRTFSANEINGNSAMIALAPKAKKLFVGISEPKSGVNVIDLDSEKIVATILSNGNLPVTGVAVDESRSLLFYMNQDKDTIVVANSTTYKPLAEFTVGDCPFAIRLDEKRGLGAISNQADHSLTLFDLAKVATAVK